MGITWWDAARDGRGDVMVNRLLFKRSHQRAVMRFTAMSESEVAAKAGGEIQEH